MQSIKLVSLDRLVDSVTLFSIVVGMVLFVNFVYLVGKTQGFEAGYLAKEAENASSLSKEAGAPIIFPDDRTYVKLALNYRYLSCFLLIFVVLGLAADRISINEMKVLVAIINVILLILAVRYLLWLLGLKNPELNESLGSPYNSLVLETVAHDRASLVLILALLFGQVGSILLNFRNLSARKVTMDA